MALQVTLTGVEAQDFIEHYSEFLQYLATDRVTHPAHGKVTLAVLPELSSAKGTLLDAKFGVSAADLSETGVHFADHGNLVPNVPPAPPVLSTAVAVTSETVPEDGTPTSVDPDLAFGQAAQSSVPAAPTAAPPPPPPAPPVNAGTPPPIVPIPPQVDSTGLPWDQRIHSGSKSINADGSWRTKKGVAATLVTSVTAELKALMSADVRQLPLPNVPAAPAPANADAPDGFVWVHVDGHGMVLRPVTPPAPPPPAETPAAPPAAVPAPPTTTVPSPAVVSAPSAPAGGLTFADLIAKASAMRSAGILTNEKILEVCKSHGVPSIGLLAKREELVPQIAAALGVV